MSTKRAREDTAQGPSKRTRRPPSAPPVPAVEPEGVEQWFLPSDVMGSLVNYLPARVVFNKAAFTLFLTCRYFHVPIVFHGRTVKRWQTLITSLDATPFWNKEANALETPPSRTIIEKNVGAQTLTLTNLPKRFFPVKSNATFLPFMPNLRTLLLPVSLFDMDTNTSDRGDLLQHVTGLETLVISGYRSSVSPSFLNHLPRLTTLVLQNCSLSAHSVAAAYLMAATQLTSLDLDDSSNHPHPSMRLLSLAQLRTLTCSPMGERAVFWSDMATLKYLQRLTLSHVAPDLTHTMVAAWTALAPTLETLTLFDFYFPLHTLGVLKNLRSLTLERGIFRDLSAVDSPVFPFPRLETLKLSYGLRYPREPLSETRSLRASDFSELRAIRTLFVHSNIELDVADVAHLSTLEHLSVSFHGHQTKDSLSIREPIMQLAALKTLNVEHRDSIIDDGLLDALMHHHPSMRWARFSCCHGMRPARRFDDAQGRVVEVRMEVPCY